MTSPVRRWLPVLVWVLVIYTTIPFVRDLREWFVARWNPVVISWLVAATLVAAAAVVGLQVLSRRADRTSIGRIAWIGGVTSILVVWTFSLRRSPEEAVHFLEYGVLAILIHRALRSSMPNPLVFVAGALIGSIVGTVDEIIQWASPSRYWDWRDLVLNGGAGALVQLILWRIAPGATRFLDLPSMRIVSRLAAAQIILVTACLANTPARVALWAAILPGCGHLTSSLNPMAEYGNRFVVPDLGVFKSRLKLEELAREDETRAREVAALIDGARRQYGVFLDTWPVSRDPFTYEARVHLFARDRNVAKARERGWTGPAARDQLNVAWNENRLMEEFFGSTLEHSSYRWQAPLRQRVEAAHDPDFRFRSAVGSHLITVASEATLRTVLLTLAAAMIGADLGLGWRQRRQP